MLTVMKQVPGNPTFRLIAGRPHTFSFYVYIWQKGMTEYWSDSWGHEGWEMTSGSQLIQQWQLEYLSNYKLLIPHNLAQYNYSEALQTFLEAFPLSISFDNSSHWIHPNLWSYPAACIAIYHQHILVSKYCGMNTFLLLHGKQKHKQPKKVHIQFQKNHQWMIFKILLYNSQFLHEMICTLLWLVRHMGCWLLIGWSGWHDLWWCEDVSNQFGLSQSISQRRLSLASASNITKLPSPSRAKLGEYISYKIPAFYQQNV